MVRSMNSAVSSLKNHQTRMDTIGNNIANINTTAFKAGRTVFKDTYSQLVGNATGHRDERGGMNPYQVGLGMNISSIDNNMEKGNIDTTNIATDLYIDGKGYFLTDADDGRLYTRDGSFRLDEFGYLVTSSGRFVMGYQADKDGTINGNIDKIKVPIQDILEPNVTTKIELEGNLDSSAGDGIINKRDPKDPSKIIDMTKELGTLDGVYDKIPVYENGEKVGEKYVLKSEYGDKESPKQKSILGKSVETKVIDSLGVEHRIRLDYIKTSQKGDGDNGESTWNVFAFYTAPNGAMIPCSGTTGTGGGSLTGGEADGLAAKDIKFLGNGNLEKLTAPAEHKLKFAFSPQDISGAQKIEEFKVDYSMLTQFSSPSTAFAKTNNGYPLGELNEFGIGADGKIMGKFSNGSSKALGQIVIATFSNESGLQKKGDNLWAPTQNSGDPNIVKPGGGGGGQIIAGALEMSNVDMAKEFTNMIVTQRGFQANSRVITTTDTMLEELINLKR